MKLDVRDFVKGIDRVIKEQRTKAIKFLKWGCMTIERDAKKRLKPWNPPLAKGVDTGRLRASIIYEVDETNLVGRVGPTVHYAKYLEFGTRPRFLPFAFFPEILRWCKRHGLPVEKMWGLHITGKPYPFMRPAYKENIGKIKEKAKEILKI